MLRLKKPKRLLQNELACRCPRTLGVSKNQRRGELLEVRVHPDDLGRVIGRNGRTARSLRKVVSALKGKDFVRVDVVETDRR